MKTQIVKWGNSLAVRIPKPVVQEARIKEGDSLEIKATPDRIELCRITHAPRLVRLIAQITPKNRYDEFSAKVEVGKEIIEW